MFEEPSPESMERIERFFFDRGAAVMHEVSPLAGVATLDLLCARGYRPMEISSVLYQPILDQYAEWPAQDAGGITVRVINPKKRRSGLEDQRARMGARSS
jgi:hypothetical protein